MTERDKEIESSVVVTPWPGMLVRLETQSSTHAATRDPLTAAVAHRYLLFSFSSKPNKMFVIWESEIHRNCARALWTCGVSCLCFYWWVMNWTNVGDCELNLCCLWCFFFFFGLLWLCDSVTLCLWLSLLHYIDKRDRQRESRVCRDSFFFVDW